MGSVGQDRRGRHGWRQMGRAECPSHSGATARQRAEKLVFARQVKRYALTKPKRRSPLCKPPKHPTVELSDYEKERGKPMPSLNHAVIQMQIGVDRGFRALQGVYHPVASELALRTCQDGRRLTPDLSVYPKLTPGLERHDIDSHENHAETGGRNSRHLAKAFRKSADKLDLYFEHGVAERRGSCRPGMPRWWPSTNPPETLRPQVYHHWRRRVIPVTGLTARLEEIFA